MMIPEITCGPSQYNFALVSSILLHTYIHIHVQVYIDTQRAGDTHRGSPHVVMITDVAASAIELQAMYDISL